jgi:hypothetical protein
MKDYQKLLTDKLPCAWSGALLEGHGVGALVGDVGGSQLKLKGVFIENL